MGKSVPKADVTLEKRFYGRPFFASFCEMRIASIDQCIGHIEMIRDTVPLEEKIG